MLICAERTVRPWLVATAIWLVLVSGIGCRKQVDSPGTTPPDPSIVEATGSEAPRTDLTPADDTAVDDGLIPIPDGSPEELLDFMNELAVREPAGETPAEQDAELECGMETRVKVAERIIASQDTPPWLRLVAVESKLEAMRTLVILAKDSAFEDLQAYAISLAEQDDSDLAQLGRLSQFQLELDKLMAQMSDEPSPLMAALDQVLRHERPDRTVHRVVSSVADLLSQIGYVAEAAEAAEKIYHKFSEHDEQEVREASLSLYATLMLHAAVQQEDSGNVAQARTMVDGVAEAIRDAPPAIAEQIRESLEPAQRRLGLLGQPLEVPSVESEKAENDDVQDRADNETQEAMDTEMDEAAADQTDEALHVESDSQTDDEVSQAANSR